MSMRMRMRMGMRMGMKTRTQLLWRIDATNNQDDIPSHKRTLSSQS